MLRVFHERCFGCDNVLVIFSRRKKPVLFVRMLNPSIEQGESTVVLNVPTTHDGLFGFAKYLSSTCYVSIVGMTCAGSVDYIERKLIKYEGIRNVLVVLLTQKAEIQYDPARLVPLEIVSFVEALGFSAKLIEFNDNGLATVDVQIHDMSCSNCVRKIEGEMSRISGIVAVFVSLSTCRAHFEYKTVSIGPRTIIRALNALGFQAELVQNKSKLESSRYGRKILIKTWRNSFFLSLAFSLPSMLVMYLFVDQGLPNQQHVIVPGLSVENLVMFLFCTPVQLFGCKYFYIEAIEHRTTNMDVLIVLATTIAYSYSLLVVLAAVLVSGPSPTSFFNTPPMVITLVALGRWLQHIAKCKMTETITKLTSLQPAVGRLVKLDHKNGALVDEEFISASLIERGDLIRIRPGEMVPVDGRIVEGKSMCDESVITGEAMPVAKTTGSIVIGGTWNQNGPLLIEATHVGHDTALSQIIRLVEDAQTSKAPIQQLADRVASLFVPFVCAVSCVTLLTWLAIGCMRYDILLKYSTRQQLVAKVEVILEFAFEFAITVLCVSCPCALGLATPTALMVGTDHGARNGILIKGD